ncbi:MAG: cytochrome c [Firmicutes bacterium]|nr:cytochrome c [Bacillota bacterium]
MRVASLVTLVALAAALPLAAQGSDTRGKFFFRKDCKSCHVAGKGSDLTPLSKTQAQWKKFFEAGKHGKDPLSKLGTPAKLLDIKTFLVNHASDSPQPETCGG